jgi:hypothetical protein
MPVKTTARGFRPIHVLLLSASLVALAGCGTDGFAPDALIENPGADAFLTRVGQACGKESVGNQPLNWLLSTSNDDTTLVDTTSKLYLGTFTRAQYRDAINDFYPTGTNQPALNCIVGLLPSGNAD